MNTNESRGYVLNGSTVLPLGSTAMPSRAPHDPKKVRRRIRRGFLGLFILPIVIGALIVLATILFSPATRDLEILPAAAVVSIDESDVAVVVYADTSRPGFFEPMFQTRAAAIRLSDGTQLWDQRLDEELGTEAAVLAGNSSWVYLGTDAGLVILDARSGAVHARGDGISGIGGGAVLAASAYGFDPEANAVVALTGTGAVVQVPVGRTDAVAADAAVARRWQGVLSASPFLDVGAITRSVEAAATADGTSFEIVSVAESVDRDALVITSPDGRTIRRTELVGAEILPDVGLDPRLGMLLGTGQFVPGDSDAIDADDIEALLGRALGAAAQHGVVVAPAGAAQGFVLVQHRESVNAERMLISTIDIASGQIVATVEMQNDAERAIAGPSGTTTVIAAAPGSWGANVLLVLDGDGSLRELEVGAVPWWLVTFS
ncbi:PA2928 family protein [Microbacterium sp. SD291]|uniref:PA2928 family protein n=1 Tax=Microbacterium sp. SD291 TaxID=2782007 RepID=UPI001A95A293|nr:PA2928 family protein [Microbacterium sp. SD291]MBO0981268.1 hypothetical protein [Microbacterium sp. SD291]